MFRYTRLPGLATGLLVLAWTVSTIGQPPAGRGPMGPRGGGDPTLRLLGLPEVQKELELMDDQISKLKAVDDDYRQKMQKEFSGLRDLPEDQRRAKFAELGEKRKTWNEEAMKKVQEILLPPQFDRLHEISLQVRGTAALNDEKVQQDLGLSDQQKAKLKEIREKAEGEMRSMFESLRGIPAEQRQAKMRENRDKFQKLFQDSQDQTIGTLTAQQRDKFEQMKGKKIEIQWPQRGRGPGGPGTPPAGGPPGPPPGGPPLQ